MGIGASIFLIALGAILAFAVEYTVGGLDIQVVGYILMIAGIVGLIMTAFIFSPRNRGNNDVVEERRVRDDRY